MSPESKPTDEKKLSIEDEFYRHVGLCITAWAKVDAQLFEICAAEGRALVTLDRDFGQVTRFQPERSAGIIVLDVGPRTTLEGIIGRLRDFLTILERNAVAGSLWIVEPGRVRVHLRDDG